MKRILGSALVFTGVALAALPDVIPFMVVLRDFQPSHPDFETFDARAQQISASPVAGYMPFISQCYGDFNKPVDINLNVGDWSPTASACEDGYDCGTPRADGSIAKQAYYGLYECTDPVTQVKTQIKTHRHKALGCKEVWANPVYITKGMVQPVLAQPTADPLTWYPKRNAGPMTCHNDWLEAQWFQDVPGMNIRVEAAMWLSKVPNTLSTYYIDSREMPGGAYFPLDESNRINFAPDYLSTATFGPQSLDLWCPPYGALPAGSGFATWQMKGGYDENTPQDEKLACQALLANGGPRSSNAASVVANTYPAYQARLHNYAFTMMGYTQFKYNAGEVFEFSGDDDMWIFIDGILVADLGGTHAPAETRVDLTKIANSRGGWTDKSSHDLHFFYADRQTNGSNLRITTTLTEVIDVPWGAPRIKSAKLEETENTFQIEVNSQLSDATLGALPGYSSTGYVGMLASRLNHTDANGVKYYDTLVVNIQSIQPLGQDKGNFKYRVVGYLCNGAVCDANTITPVASGDSLAFNFYAADGHKFEMLEAQPAITNAQNIPVKSFKWGGVMQGEVIGNAVNIKPADKSVARPEIPNEQTLFEGGPTTVVGEAGNGAKYFPLGSKGDMLPKNKTGEILLTAYPSDKFKVDSMRTNYGWGMPPLAIENKVLKPNQVSVMPDTNTTIAHCVSAPGADGYDNSCLSLGFTVSGPFKANVQVFDHLGHFVSAYQAGVDEKTMRRVQATQASGGSECGALPGVAAVKSGMVYANVEVYPFSQTGRKLGSGVYILKVDVISEKFDYCQTINNTPIQRSSKYGRSFEQIKAAFMRVKIK